MNMGMFHFDDFCLDTVNHELLRGGRPVQLKPKAYDTLLILIENHGRVVGKEELMTKLWGDTFVEEGNLSQNIYELRKVFGETARKPRYIENLPKRGYRFIGKISSVDSSGDRPNTNPIRSAAVLPFLSVGLASGDDFLEMALADTLTTELSRVRGLTVRPFSAVATFRDNNRDPLVAGRLLKVDAVIDGSLQLYRDKVRVNVRLLDLSRDRILWAGKFDDDIANLFDLQDKVTEQTIGAFSNKLESRNSGSPKPGRWVAPAVHELILKAGHHWHKWTPEDWQKTVEYGNEAIKLDSECAQGYSWIGAAYCTLGIFGVIAPTESFTRARSMIKKALSIDDGLSEAHEVMGAIHLFYDWDRAAAAVSLRRSTELNPNNARAHDLYALLLFASGNFEEAIRRVRRALEIDPLSMIINTDVGYALYYSRRYDEAEQQFYTALGLDAYFAHAYFGLGFVLVQQGKATEAIAAVRKANQLSGRDDDLSPELAFVYGSSGEKEKAASILSDFLASAENSYVDPYRVALVYIGLDDKEKAFDWLNKARSARSRELITLKTDPVFDSLANDERFTDLVSKIGLPSGTRD